MRGGGLEAGWIDADAWDEARVQQLRECLPFDPVGADLFKRRVRSSAGRLEKLLPLCLLKRGDAVSAAVVTNRGTTQPLMRQRSKEILDGSIGMEFHSHTLYSP